LHDAVAYPDASYVYRPGRERFFFKKDYLTFDSHRRVITAVVLTPGAVAEDHVLEKLLDKQPLKVQKYVLIHNMGLHKTMHFVGNVLSNPVYQRKVLRGKRISYHQRNSSMILRKISTFVLMGKSSGG